MKFVGETLIIYEFLYGICSDEICWIYKNVWLCSFKSKMNPGWESESLCYLGETVVVFLSEALHRYFLEHKKRCIRCIVFCLCLSDAEQWIILSQQEVTVAG